MGGNLTDGSFAVVTVSFAPCWVQLESERVNTHAAPSPAWYVELSAKLAAKVSSVVGELASHAQEVDRPVGDRADVVAHHIAAGLRVRVSQDTPQLRQSPRERATPWSSHPFSLSFSRGGSLAATTARSAGGDAGAPQFFDVLDDSDASSTREHRNWWAFLVR